MSQIRWTRTLRFLPAPLRLLGLLAAAAWPTLSAADEPAATDAPAASQYLRLARDDDGQPLALQTAIVRFTPADEKQAGLEVDLIGVIHIGEQAYYQKLNEAFKKYDAVLYELVAPKDQKPAAGQRSGHPIAAMQTGMQRMLGLAFQLDEIDYRAENLVHADMSPDEFEGAMAKRDENFTKMILKMYFREVGRMLVEQNKPASARRPGATDADLAMALFSSNRGQALKLILAEQFADAEAAMKSIEGPDGSAIISDRNKVALKVLREQIDGGKKRLAVFYGAGHMPAFEKSLAADFGLKPGEPQWLNAWELRGDEKAAEEKKEAEPAGASR